jgi:hypothetical protein
MGRASVIKRRTSHVSVMVKGEARTAPRDAGRRAKKGAAAAGGATTAAKTEKKKSRKALLGKGSRLKRVGIAALIGFGVGCPVGVAAAPKEPSTARRFPRRRL